MPGAQDTSVRVTRRRVSGAAAAASKEDEDEGQRVVEEVTPAYCPAESKRLLQEVGRRVEAAIELGRHELPVVKTPERAGQRVLDPAYFGHDAITTARWLLGSRIVRVLPDGRRLRGRIVEVESYMGVLDAAAHSFRGRRGEKNEIMYSAGGTAYVYFIYGMYHCCNIICGGRGDPTGVLVRAIEPDFDDAEGIEAMIEGRLARQRAKLGAAAAPITDADRRKVLASGLGAGPGRLTMALSLDRGLNGADLLHPEAPLYLEYGDHVEAADVVVSGRIGVDYAGEWSRAPLRWAVRGNAHVSKPWPWRADGGKGGKRKATTVAVAVAAATAAAEEKEEGEGKLEGEGKPGSDSSSSSIAVTKTKRTRK